MKLYSVPGYPDAGTYMYEELWDHAAVSVEGNCKCKTCFCCRCLEKIREIDSVNNIVKNKDDKKTKTKLKPLSSKKLIKERGSDVRTKTIDEQTLAILSRVTVEGNNVLLTCGQLDRKQYLAVNEVLTNIGGKWNKKAKAHIFDSDPTERLESVLLTGEIIPPKKFGYFPTPENIVNILIELANIKSNCRVLEPSAGQGAIVSCIDTSCDVTLCELLPDNCAELKKQGYDPVECDFLEFDSEELFDRIIANPPFSYEGHPQADVDHVLHMWELLKPGGKLVSVMGAGVVFRENKKTVEFREFVDKFGRIERLPEGSFKSSGTMVNTIIVVLDKPITENTNERKRTMTTKKKATSKKVIKKKDYTNMTRQEYVETITEMCERLNDSGLLDELNTIELEEGLNAEKLTDLFCDAVEYIDSPKVDKSGELDDDIVSFYEAEPWKTLPDEGDEQVPEETKTLVCECEEVTDDEPEVEQEKEPEKPNKKIVKKNTDKVVAKNKVVKKIVKKPESKPKPKKVVKKKTEPVKETKPKIVKDKPNKVEKPKPVKREKTERKSSTVERDEFGFRIGTKKNVFVETLRKKPMTMNDIKGQKWNTNYQGFYDTFLNMMKTGKANRTDEGIMYIVGSNAAKEMKLK